MLRIKLVKSPIGNNWRNRQTVTALGLRKIHQVVEQPDNGSIRGMIHKVQHMVTFEVVEGEPSKKSSKPAGKAAAPKAKKGAETPIAENVEAPAKPKRTTKKKETTEEA
jgi:large subunit ribosomal protein L30